MAEQSSKTVKELISQGESASRPPPSRGTTKVVVLIAAIAVLAASALIPRPASAAPSEQAARANKATPTLIVQAETPSTGIEGDAWTTYTLVGDGGTFTAAVMGGLLPDGSQIIISDMVYPKVGIEIQATLVSPHPGGPQNVDFFLKDFAPAEPSTDLSPPYVRLGYDLTHLLPDPIAWSMVDESVPDYLDVSEVKAAFARGTQTWIDAAAPTGLQFNEPGTVGRGNYLEPDGRNTVAWVDTPWEDDGFLGRAKTHRDPNGVPIEFDIVLNTDHRWTHGIAEGQFDIDSVLLHEIGHILGFAHNHADRKSVMFHNAPPNSTKRELTEGDSVGAHAFYAVKTEQASLTSLCLGQEITIRGDGGVDHLVGTQGDDVIAGFGGNDEIFGLGGNDVICAGPGKDVVRAGDGNDRVSGGPGKDRLIGGPGNDRLKGNAGDDWLAGGPGRDRLNGSGGKDVLLGGAGRDRLKDPTGADRLNGGKGVDQCRSGDAEKCEGL